MAKHPVVHLEISAKDPKAAGKFYSDLFGWKIEVDERFNYVQFHPEEGGIGGAFSDLGEGREAGEVWPYIQVEVDQMDSIMAKANSLGAQTLMSKTEIPGVGWFSIFRDPTGNKIGLFAGGGPS